MRKFLMSLVVLAVLAPAYLVAKEAPSATIYKSPYCGCCEQYVKYLRGHGFEVTVQDMQDLSVIKRMAGVPEALESCHTAMIGGYVVEGHVPISTLAKLLKERPDIKGVALPGMPVGSPGMPGPKTGALTIYEIRQGPSKVYAVE